MRNLFAATIAVAALASAVPASAYTITFQPGTPGLESPNKYPAIWNANVVQDFDGTTNFGSETPAAGTYLYNSSSSSAARPAFGSSGNFAGLGNGQTYSLTFSVPVQVVSFILGSLDTFNVVTLFRDVGGPITLQGSQIKQGGDADGNQVEGDTNGRVIYDARKEFQFTGISFSNFNGSGVAFEFDDIVTAAPEPAAWGMMILGFGLVGGALRRRRTAVKLATA